MKNALIVIAVIGIAVSLALTLARPNGQEQVDRLIRSDPAKVRLIRLTPGYHSPIASTVTITDRTQIARFMGALRTATSVFLNHPAEVWVCYIMVQTDKGSSYGTISLTSNLGLLLLPHSGEIGGWMYGGFRIDDLLPIIREIAKQK